MRTHGTGLVAVALLSLTACSSDIPAPSVNPPSTTSSSAATAHPSTSRSSAHSATSRPSTKPKPTAKPKPKPRPASAGLLKTSGSYASSTTLTAVTCQQYSAKDRSITISTTPNHPANQSLVSTLRLHGSRLTALQVRGTYVDIETTPKGVSVPISVGRTSISLHHVKVAVATTVRGKVRHGPVYLDGSLRCTAGKPRYGFGVIAKGALQLAGSAKASVNPRITTCTDATTGAGLQASLTGGWAISVQRGPAGEVHLAHGPTHTWARPAQHSAHPTLTRKGLLFTFHGVPVQAPRGKGRSTIVRLTGSLTCPAGTLSG